MTTPALTFAVTGVTVPDDAATPVLRVGLTVREDEGVTVRGLSLHSQARVVIEARAYDAYTRLRLAEVWGDPEHWARAPRSLLWTQSSQQVPEFTGITQIALDLPCTYDFDVASTKYLHALRDGDVPVELLFTGTFFWDGDDGLQAAILPASSEATFRMPASLWREAMDRFFPNSAWLRIPRETFDRLWSFRTQRALPSWDAALSALLSSKEEPRS